MWVHESSRWPEFTWDNQKLVAKLAATRNRQGLLIGKMEGLGFDSQREASLNILTSDVVKSSAIEGENLNPTEVRASIARRLGIKMEGMIPVSRNVEAIVEVILDATQYYAKPLTKQRLFDWHAGLFPNGRSGAHTIIVGNWRDDVNGPMQVVSGHIRHEKVHFQAPSADRLNTEMIKFLAWFDGQSDIDPVLKAGIAHLWFVTIHPFDDGNGRIGRAIADMMLARSDQTSYRFYSLSAQFELEHKEYYNQLERAQRGSMDITDWLEWFLDCLGRAIYSSQDKLSKILFKAQLWNKINNEPVNDRQRLIINRMLEDDFVGRMSTSKYAKLAKCSPAAAQRDIQELRDREIFVQNPGKGRSTSYRLTDNL